jgi:hypothetical protein
LVNLAPMRKNWPAAGGTGAGQGLGLGWEFQPIQAGPPSEWRVNKWSLHR